LEGWYSTIELHPHYCCLSIQATFLLYKDLLFLSIIFFAMKMKTKSIFKSNNIGLNEKSSHDVLSFLHGIRNLGFQRISPDEIILKPRLPRNSNIN